MEINIYILTGIIAFLFGSSLAFFVGHNSWHDPPRRSFAIVTQLAALWCLFPLAASFNYGGETNLLLVRLVYIPGVLAPPFILQFIFDVTENRRPTLKKLILGSAYFVSICFIFFVFHPQFIVGVKKQASLFVLVPGRIFHIFAAQYILICLISFFLLIQNLRRVESRNRTKLQYVALALTIGIFSPLFHFSSSYFKWEPFPHDIFFITYSSIIAYAIVRHQLLDIKVVIKKTIIYSSMTALVSISYISAVFVIQKIMTGELKPHLLFLFSPYSLPQLFGSLIAAILGFFVLSRNWKRPLNRTFSAFGFLASLWLGAASIAYSLGFEQKMIIFKLMQVSYSAVICMVIPYLRLTTLITQSKRLERWTNVSAFVAIFFVATVWLTDWFIKDLYYFHFGFYPNVGWIHPFFLGWLFASMSLIHLILFLASRDEKLDSRARNQSKYIWLAFIAFTPAIVDFIPNYGIDIYPAGFLFVLIFGAVSAYAIVRHQLLDVRVVIKRTLFYSAMTIIVSLVYLSLVFLFHTLFLKGDKGTASFLVNFTGILFIAITFKPLEIAIHRFMERRFFKGTIIEIAEQKAKLETELERRERLKSVGILAAGMAHEIKNPLTAINTFADYLPTKYDDPEFREKFSRIVKQEVARVKDIVTNLLLFSKPTEPVRREYDVDQILTDILELLTSDFLKYKITTNYHPKGAKAFVDPDQIKQCFLNIIMNSIDAMPNGGTLTISVIANTGGQSHVVKQSDLSDCHATLRHARNDEENLLITISDTGCGIPQDKLPHIFDPFYTDKEQGTGLGLAVTHSIIEKNQGKIEVESEVGVGTVFRIILPVGGSR